MKKIKYIYLDQNKWIELAKGLKEKKTEYVALKNKIDKKIKSEEWAFPISIIHLAETMKRNDEASRNDILNLMYDMSKGYAICDYGDADHIEFQYWIENMSMSYKNILPSIITNDYAKIIGISNKSILKKVIDNLNFPIDEVKIQFANDCMNKFKSHRFIFDYIANQSVDMSKDEKFYHNQYLIAKNKFDKWRDYCKSLDEYKEKYVFTAYTIQMFMAEYETKINNLSSVNQQNIKSIFTNPNKDADFLEAIPGFNVYNRLVYELLTNKNREIHNHDFFDIAFLRVAIPYCDIVICEKHWGHIVSKLGLDKKYDTVVSKKLIDLEEL